jgi:hypothetical protein
MPVRKIALPDDGVETFFGSASIASSGRWPA